MKRVLLLAMCLILAGCATVPPVMRVVPSTETFNARSGVVVDSVNDFFKNENIPVRKGSEHSGIVETEEVKVPYEGFEYVSDYCDCGTLGGLYVYHGILGAFRAYVKETDNSRTTLHIESSFRASLWLNDTFMGWVVCQSKGYFESKLIKHVNDALKKKTK
ncbi:MAG: hypothetical protein AB1499_18665 [Nitrospirota bacterium]